MFGFKQCGGKGGGYEMTRMPLGFRGGGDDD